MQRISPPPASVFIVPCLSYQNRAHSQKRNGGKLISTLKLSKYKIFIPPQFDLLFERRPYLSSPIERPDRKIIQEKEIHSKTQKLLIYLLKRKPIFLLSCVTSKTRAQFQVILSYSGGGATASSLWTSRGLVGDGWIYSALPSAGKI